MPLQRFLLYFCALIVVCFSALPHALPTPEVASQAAQDRIAASITDSGSVDTLAEVPDLLATIHSSVSWRLALHRRPLAPQRLSGFATLQGDIIGDVSAPRTPTASLKPTTSTVAV